MNSRIEKDHEPLVLHAGSVMNHVNYRLMELAERCYNELKSVDLFIIEKWAEQDRDHLISKALLGDQRKIVTAFLLAGLYLKDHIPD